MHCGCYMGVWWLTSACFWQFSMTSVFRRNHFMPRDPASPMLLSAGNQATAGVSFVTCHRLNERHPKRIIFCWGRTRERKRHIARERERKKLKLTSCLNSHTDRYGSAISAIASRTFARIFTKVGSKTVAFCTSSSSVGTTISFQQLACQILINIASWHSTIFCPEFKDVFEVCCGNVGTADALPINERLTPWSQAASNFTRSKCRESGPLLPGLVRALCQARTARHTETKQGDQTTISFNMFQQVSTTRFRMVQDHSLRLTKFSHSKRRTAVPAGEEEEGCTGLTTSSASSAEKTDQRRLNNAECSNACHWHKRMPLHA